MARRITATRKAWDELTPNEKADLVHKENRQLHDLLRSAAIAQPAPAAIVAGRLQRNRRFVDSPLEGTGFELLVAGAVNWLSRLSTRPVAWDGSAAGGATRPPRSPNA
jgi:hypothetical protein